MNSTHELPPVPALSDKQSLLYVEERNGHLTAFVFRGEVKYVSRVLKMWASGRFTSEQTEDTTYYTVISEDRMIATIARDNVHRHWYMIRLMD
jgi:hypothetical protein